VSPSGLSRRAREGYSRVVIGKGSIVGGDGAAPLREAWYYALPGHRLAAGAMLAKTLLGEPVLIGRDAAGAVFALRDLCPHRGVPLSCGSFDGKAVECCYHGWR